jgi:ABC-2 type transport system ATP-binding protein
MLMSTTYLQTKDLTKDYGRGRGAIDINIEINPGEIVGFIGPNGAGKTTTMRLVMGMIKPDAGEVTLFGKPITNFTDIDEIIHRIGFLSGEVNFYGAMSSKQLFAYAGKIYGKDFSARARELSEQLDLDQNKPFKYMSLGNKKKVGIIHALLHSPDLIILDEPTSGLDPLIQQKVLNLLKEARKEGKAVFLSSHVLSEVQQICDRIIMIKDSKIIMQDDTKSILAKAVKIFRITDLSDKLENELKQLKDVKDIQKTKQEVLIYATDPAHVIEALVANKRYDFYIERTSLEDMFLAEYK